MEDREIVELFLMRSEDALRYTEEKYGAAMRSSAKAITGSGEDAEECVNDAFYDAWKSIPPKRPANLKTYLFKLVRNRALMRLRMNTAEKRGGGTAAIPLHELEEAIPGETENDGESEAVADVVRAFVRGLDPDTRRVFLSRYYAFRDIKTISAQYGYTQSKVKMMLKRSRDALRKKLESEGLL